MVSKGSRSKMCEKGFVLGGALDRVSRCGNGVVVDELTS
jgi:hypothetical protein